MRGALQRQRPQVGQREVSAAGVESAGSHLATQHRGDLQIDKLGRRKVLAAQPGTRTVTVVAVIGQGSGDDAGVNDEHARSARWRRQP